MYSSSGLRCRFGAGENFFDHLPRSTDATAMRFEILSADFPTNTTGFEIIEGLDDRPYEASRIADALARPTDLENSNDLPGVLEMRSEQDRTSRVDWLDEVMSADRNECPADEGDRRRRIHRGQLTQSIENEYFARNEMATLETTAQVNAPTTTPTQIQELIRTLDLTGSQHQDETVSRLLCGLEGIEQGDFFVGMRTAADDHGHIRKGANQIDRERWLLFRRIEFQIPGHAYPIFGHTERNEALGIEIRSRPDGVDPSKRRPEKRSKSAIARKRAVR
jgi:hypothetical protein